MLRIPWTTKKTIIDFIEVTEEAGQTKLLVNGKKKTKGCLHSSRNEQRRFRTHSGKLKVRRGRGRQREQMIDNLAAWMNIEKTISVISSILDRGVWKVMVANTLKQGYL